MGGNHFLWKVRNNLMAFLNLDIGSYTSYSFDRKALPKNLTILFKLNGRVFTCCYDVAYVKYTNLEEKNFALYSVFILIALIQFDRILFTIN